MGSITPDLADYVKVADMDNALNTKVNVTDMRKPASDVAGIEEVNAKQDAIGYTPADDSKVVHDNHDGTITANGTVFNLLNSLSASSIPQNPTKDYNTLPQGLALMSEVNGEPANMPPVKSTYLTLTIASSFATGRKRQLAWLDAGANSSNNNYTYIRYCVGNTWSSWDSIPTSSQISSLIPSTLADTTKDANFTRKLQKSGIDVATTSDVSSAVNTATANMANTTKLANFTAGLQVNGKDVGTGGGDKLTTPWVVTNYQSTDTMGPHGCNEATGWRIYNDILYYYGTFYGATVSETVIFNLYTAYPDFKKTFKTLGSSPELIYQTSSGFWAFNDWGNQMVGNEGNLLIGIENTATPLSVNIVYPLDRL